MPQPLPIKNVLVVDDDEVLRGLVEALLSLEGYNVTLASSGEQGLAALRATPGFDLILTDLHMPGIEGEELVRALRVSSPGRVLLIGMSASEAQEGVFAHLDGFLAKPFDLAALQDTVQTATEQHPLHAPAHAVSEPSASATKVVAEAPALDDAILRSLMKMIPAAQLGKLYEMTIGDVEKRHGRMEIAAGAGDLAEVQREAHAIKGSCGMVGALEIQALAAVIEGGTTLDTSALVEIPAACLRLRRMLDVKLQTV